MTAPDPTTYAMFQMFSESLDKSIAERYLSRVTRDDLPKMGSEGFSGYGQTVPQVESEAEQLWARELNYHVKVLWNGENELRITPHFIGWKGCNVVANEIIKNEEEDGSIRLRFTTFAPEQMSEWVPGQVGMVESFDITFSPSRQEFLGAFQRQGEGILTVRGWATGEVGDIPDAQLVAQVIAPGESRREVVNIGKALATVARDESTDSVGCPVCFNEWHAPGVVRVETKCKHSYCMKCIISVCNLTPPVTSGRCALCRADVRLDELLSRSVSDKSIAGYYSLDNAEWQGSYLKISLSLNANGTCRFCEAERADSGIDNQKKSIVSSCPFHRLHIQRTHTVACTDNYSSEALTGTWTSEGDKITMHVTTVNHKIEHSTM